MPNRTIKSTAHNQSVQLIHAMSSLFVLELLAPSKAIYLFSPWVTDVPLLDSAFGQFRPLLPENEQEKARLSTILNKLAERGSQIYVMTRPKAKRGENYTDLFLSRLGDAIQRKYVPTLHEKGLVTDHFYFRGSMNFTYSGVNLNDEHSELSTEPDVIAQALINARQRWESVT